MDMLIAYAWLTTVLVTIALAGCRGIPILNAFGWIDTRRGLYASLIVMATVCGLVALQLAYDAQLLGQSPMVWATLVALVYAWVCISYRLRKA